MMNQIHIPDLKKNIKNSGLVKGVWMMTVNPAFAEIACLLEIDFVVIDLEHGAITLTDLPHILRGFRGNTAARSNTHSKSFRSRGSRSYGS
jgi:2-keto-3-deoxy-L-rhamnonate aldolase RhmA